MNENNNTRKEQQEDDGSLSFLAIPQDEGNKHFNCRETTQQKLINLTFWVCDFIEGVKTKFGAERFLVKIKKNRDDKDRQRSRKVLYQFKRNKVRFEGDKETERFPSPGYDESKRNTLLL